jgi:hypothetical protein
MSSRQGDIRAILEKVNLQVAHIEEGYNKSLLAQAIDPAMRIDMKNALENLRSVLDYIACDIRARFCPTYSLQDRFYFPILPDKATFDKKMDQWFPGLRQAAPAVVTLLE